MNLSPTSSIRLAIWRAVPLLLGVALAIGSAGCHQKATPAPAPSTSAVQPGATETPQPLAGEVDPAMTAQLRVFMNQTGRAPTDFKELARVRLDRVPRAPAGMKWAIDLATQEVKLVKQ